MSRDLIHSITQQMPGFSKGQKLIAQYILAHYDKAAFMTAAKLGMTVGVSESTVVRFASELGFEGYPQLQRALQELIRNRLTSVQRMEVTSDQLGEGNILHKVLNLDIEKIRRTMEKASVEDFEQAVDTIVNAKNIYILGVRSASALSGFMNTTSTSEMFEQIMRIKEGDVFIGITFPRYSKRTVNAANFAKQNGAKVIAITDSNISPIAETADHLLLARSDMASFVDSLVAPLSVINALIVAVGIRKKDEISSTYERLEQIWDEYNVYEKIEEPRR